MYALAALVLITVLGLIAGEAGARWLRRRQHVQLRTEVLRVRISRIHCPICDEELQDGQLVLSRPGEPLVHAECITESGELLVAQTRVEK